MNKGVLSDQRLEQRLPALNIAVKIRRRGVGFNQWRYDLNLVDLSANGMALFSPTFKFEPLQKVDFELSSGRFHSSGGAIVCNLGHDDNKHRYGLLFIETDQQFDAFLTGESLSSADLTRLGEEMAEQFMYQRAADQSTLFRLHNQRMVDGVRAMARRLGQMGLYIYDETGKALMPAEAIVVHKQGGLSIPMGNADNAEINCKYISLQCREDNKYHYLIGEDESFTNMVDLLNHLCRCFDQISVP